MNGDIFKTAKLIVTTASLALLISGEATAQNLREGDIDTGYFGNVAIEGYDTVAYFTVGQAMVGDPEITADWLGAEWHFASEENRNLFVADPIAYAPQYGGHCADGLAYDGSAIATNIDPESWSVINGKLYISYDPVSAAEFAETPGFVERADANWALYQASVAAE